MSSVAISEVISFIFERGASITSILSPGAGVIVTPSGSVALVDCRRPHRDRRELLAPPGNIRVRTSVIAAAEVCFSGTVFVSRASCWVAVSSLATIVSIISRLDSGARSRMELVSLSGSMNTSCGSPRRDRGSMALIFATRSSALADSRRIITNGSTFSVDGTSRDSTSCAMAF